MPMIAAMLIVGGLWICTVVDVVRRADWQVRGPRRGTWIAVVVLVPPIGSVLWLLFGRPRGAVPLPDQRMHPSMLVAPDDGPQGRASAEESEAEFMRRFHERVAQQREDARRTEH
ncbi:PLD nuclease N-terminal domain-containing protein [Rhodococcus sp. NPDC003318]|uniref:PLD nuclease N-terminal domain-containing protein n=1 Tax=Rhodococcus sp. NPDC003318 TaxID=3364503 RepID=UPI00368CDEB6